MGEKYMGVSLDVDFLQFLLRYLNVIESVCSAVHVHVTARTWILQCMGDSASPTWGAHLRLFLSVSITFFLTHTLAHTHTIAQAVSMHEKLCGQIMSFTHDPWLDQESGGGENQNAGGECGNDSASGSSGGRAIRNGEGGNKARADGGGGGEEQGEVVVLQQDPHLPFF